MLRPSPLPAAFRQKVPSGKTYFKLTETLRDLRLNTVCEEAKCPNRTECYSQGTLTFQILGNICTRRCGFCAETTGRPQNVDLGEPDRILESTRRLNLSHVVITAPARDDLEDGGSVQFARTVRLLKNNLHDLTVEVLISDFEGCENSLQTVLKSRPDVLNHNIETVRRLTPQVRAKATYERSLNILKKASGSRTCMTIKSGLMVGLGETRDEIHETFSDLSQSGVQSLTVGQYLQPSPSHLPIRKFYSPEEFSEIKKIALGFPFKKILAGPLVRSSYHAGESTGECYA